MDSIRRRITPEPVIGPRLARTRWANPPYELLQGFGGSLGQNAALPDASPPPELWVASSSQSCRIPYSSSGVLFSSGAGWVEPTDRANARPMINSAIPINCYWSVDGFRKGLNPSYELLPLARPSSAVEYGWVASHSLCIALRSCGLP